MGGQPAKLGQFPWQVSLRVRDSYSDIHFCGGSIISKRFVLTAKHCAIKAVTAVMTGTVIQNDDGAKEYQVRNFHDYPEKTDIAIMELEEPIKMTGNARAIPLASISDVNGFHEGTKFNVSGWGDLYDGSEEGSDILQWVEVPWVPHDVCNEAFGGTISDVEICAGNLEEGGVDACQGDSGGIWRII